TNISIPASVEYIDNRKLFVNNHVINSIQVDPQNETYKSIDGNLYKKTDEGLILLKYAQGKEETEFVVPDGVVEIGKGAFYRANLETIVLPNGLKRISDRAFGYLYKVANIMIPSSVEYIDGGAFVPDGTSISIQVDPQNETYKSIDGNLYEKTDKGLILISYNMDGKGETEFVVPDGVVEIGEGAFWSANLETLVLPDGLTNIQEHAFMNSVINKIIIPDSLEVIGETVFYRDDILMEVYYTGTEEQWKAIVIADGNTWLENATIYYNYTPAEN
ncbi:MAG: leucine-rich repeat protein, partial [Clostridia bacterium]|nr:leucine-rich repeat protein [Clostridia bacterium]